MRKQIVAGNWKMHNDINQAKTLVKAIKANLKDTNTTVFISPPYTNLQAVTSEVESTTIKVAAQNMHQEESGAFTGEISASMLKSVGVHSVILGHSERRAYFNETNAILKQKADTAVKHDMTILFCVGEGLEDRKSNAHFKVVETQIKEALFHLPAKKWNNIIIAYEPVWAIGTGETATPEQAQDMHAFIRKLLEAQYSTDIAEDVSVLYGGSVKPNNATDLFAKPDVDGALVGGACLNATDFCAIINAF